MVCPYFGSDKFDKTDRFTPPALRDKICVCSEECVHQREKEGKLLCTFYGVAGSSDATPRGNFVEQERKRNKNPGVIATMRKIFCQEDR